MGKKYSTKAGQVNYFEVPKPLWKRVKHLFPKVPRKPGRGRPPIPNRLVLNAIWYVLWTGCQWKALPSAAFGVSSSAAHARFQKWQEQGIFEQVMAEMVRFYDKKRKIRWKWQAIDGKNCPAPLGGADTGRNPTDRGKRGSKLHILVDKRGAPLTVLVSAANRHDKWSVQDLVFSLVVKRPDSEQHFCADKAYDSADIRDFLVLEHYQPHIKRRRRRGEPPCDPCPVPGETQYPARRWVVERTFGWLAKRRSIRTRWCKKPANWLAFLQFACAHVTYQMAFSG
ncbi:MAG: IS5 family transposase [Caldilineaceae bacterium]|nr:IS5 family transposase [Caldilineaceae bacterium]MCB0121048.1 IS5 family transposase [Caldilineaceae bacterium]